MTSVRTIGIFRTQTTCGSILVDHGVHAPWGYSKEEPGTSELTEVTEISMPVGLRDNGHPIACSLQGTSDDSCSEGRMVHIGIS